MNCLIIHDKSKLELFFRRNTFLHIYSLGDLDDFFWSHTIWYGLESKGTLKTVALLYTGFSMPNLLLFSEELEYSQLLLNQIIHILPSRFYTHLTPELKNSLLPNYRLENHGSFYKMALKYTDRVKAIDTTQVSKLSLQDLSRLKSFYKENYPENWFDPRMLETQQYFGLIQDNQILGVAGVHVYSLTYQVAALGNIATHLEHRGCGIGQRVTAKTCQSLLQSGIQYIGLNVNQKNTVAIHCYQNLGFEIVAPYIELQVNPLS